MAFWKQVLQEPGGHYEMIEQVLTAAAKAIPICEDIGQHRGECDICECNGIVPGALSLAPQHTNYEQARDAIGQMDLGKKHKYTCHVMDDLNLYGIAQFLNQINIMLMVELHYQNNPSDSPVSSMHNLCIYLDQRIGQVPKFGTFHHSELHRMKLLVISLRKKYKGDPIPTTPTQARPPVNFGRYRNFWVTVLGIRNKKITGLAIEVSTVPRSKSSTRIPPLSTYYEDTDAMTEDPDDQDLRLNDEIILSSPNSSYSEAREEPLETRKDLLKVESERDARPEHLIAWWERACEN